MPRAKIGDIIEIPTAKGLAYAHYTHQHPTYGGLIRVCDQLFETRPADLKQLVNGPVRFSTFFPLRVAVNRGIFKVVGREEIAPKNQSFPIFRGGNEDTRTGEVATWWLWDGEKQWRYEGPLNEEFYKLPIKAVWNDTLLVHRIEEGWRPENPPVRKKPSDAPRHGASALKDLLNALEEIGGEHPELFSDQVRKRLYEVILMRLILAKNALIPIPNDFGLSSESGNRRVATVLRLHLNNLNAALDSAGVKTGIARLHSFQNPDVKTQLHGNTYERFFGTH